MQKSASEIEKTIGLQDSNTFGIYIGYQQIKNTIGPTKIGRTVNVKAIERGRNQGGADWWFYAFWQCSSREETYSLEKILKKHLKDFKTKGNQSQTELYSLSLEEAKTRITSILGYESVI